MTSPLPSGGPTTLPNLSDARNLRAIVFMTIAMMFFAFDDMLIKIASASVGVGQIMTIQSLLGVIYFGILCARTGEPVSRGALLSKPILLRNVGEIIGAMCFVTALSLMPISNASAILQATPLAVTLGAALFLGEAVGWRRWSAICVGLLGVLLIVRPGMAGFTGASLFAVAAVFGIALRDLGTRAAAVNISTEMIALVSSTVIMIAAVALETLTSGWSWMTPETTAIVLTGSAIGIIGYHFLLVSLRLGEMAAIAPFRYSRIIVAILIGIVVFAERPDALTYAGAFLIVASGLYTLYREQIVGRRGRNGSAA